MLSSRGSDNVISKLSMLSSKVKALNDTIIVRVNRRDSKGSKVTTNVVIVVEIDITNRRVIIRIAKGASDIDIVVRKASDINIAARRVSDINIVARRASDIDIVDRRAIVRIREVIENELEELISTSLIANTYRMLLTKDSVNRFRAGHISYVVIEMHKNKTLLKTKFTSKLGEGRKTRTKEVIDIVRV
jgi:hypothetical protein